MYTQSIIAISDNKKLDTRYESGRWGDKYICQIYVGGGYMCTLSESEVRKILADMEFLKSTT